MYLYGDRPCKMWDMNYIQRRSKIITSLASSLDPYDGTTLSLPSKPALSSLEVSLLLNGIPDADNWGLSVLYGTTPIGTPSSIMALTILGEWVVSGDHQDFCG